VATSLPWIAEGNCQSTLAQKPQVIDSLGNPLSHALAQSLRTTADEEEIAEVTFVAAALRAGAAVTHGTHLIEGQFQDKGRGAWFAPPPTLQSPVTRGPPNLPRVYDSPTSVTLLA
jgi:hypothetical protein